MEYIDAQADSVQRISHSVYIVKLKLLDQSTLKPRFSAGQYLEVKLPDGTRSFYSFANKPNIDGIIELHIEVSDSNTRSSAIVKHFIERKPITIGLPFGDCVYSLANHFNSRLLLVSYGVGFSQIKSILDKANKCGHKKEISLITIIKSQEDFYFKSLLSDSLAKIENLKLHVCYDFSGGECRVIRDLVKPIFEEFLLDKTPASIFVGAPARHVFNLMNLYEEFKRSNVSFNADALSYSQVKKTG